RRGRSVARAVAGHVLPELRQRLHRQPRFPVSRVDGAGGPRPTFARRGAHRCEHIRLERGRHPAHEHHPPAGLPGTGARVTGLFRRLAVEASGALSASDRPRVHALLASRFEPVRPSDPAPPQVDLSPAARPHLADHSPPARSMPAQARPSPKSAPLLAPLSPAPASERVGRSPAPATLPQTASPPSPEDTRPAPRVAPFHDATAPILRRDSSPPPPGRS